MPQGFLCANGSAGKEIGELCSIPVSLLESKFGTGEQPLLLPMRAAWMYVFVCVFVGGGGGVKLFATQ
jgi:hypothetical protein